MEVKILIHWPPQKAHITIVGMNVVAMARHGLVFNHNEAMGSRKIFKYLDAHLPIPI